jgi:signal transduction histidine kinase/ActR/RegA family two-component response regulator
MEMVPPSLSRPAPGRPDSSLPEETVKQLKIQNSKLERELRVAKNLLANLSKNIEAKEALGAVLAAANAKQRAYTDMLLENCPNIIILLDDAGRLVLCTRMFLTLTGTHNFDIIKDTPYGRLFSPYFSAALLTEWTEAIDHVVSSRETVTLNQWIDFCRKGEARYYSIDLINIGSAKGAGAGISAGVLAVFIDFTDILREKERAEAASNAKSDFLAVMSHEIRTPMNAILGFNEILSRSELNPVQHKYLKDIRKSAQSLLTIINDILDFSKIEAGKMEIIDANFNLPALLDNIHSLFSLMFAEKKLAFTFHVDENIPEMICGDENRLRQVLTNLLSNAMKYTNEGFVEFSARAPQSQGGLRFDVRDSGQGIRKEDAGKLFRPFEQLDTRKNRNVAGTGLGLAICYRLCRLMGGDLWLDSEYGIGSTFSVVLPYNPVREESATAAPESPEFSAPGAKILVVDDIEINLELTAAMLEAFDIKADLALQGETALSMVQKQAYDLIFMDHMMPGMDGMETTARIRALGEAFRKIPIIALTANVVDGAEAMFLQNQFNALLAKPIDLASLSRCLKKWLPSPPPES